MAQKTLSKTGKRQDISINLNLNVRGVWPSPTLAIDELSRRLIDEGQEVFRLGLGQSPFPVPEIMRKELEANAHQREYQPAKGLWLLREAVANYNMRTKGVKCSGEDVLIGPGSKELLFLLQLVYYGDLVIPTPFWNSYAPQAKIIGRHMQWVKTSQSHDWQLTPDELERLCEMDPDRPRILIVNYPANPTGTTYNAEQLKELAAVARKYKVVLLSDEIYGELHHNGKHVSIARYYPEGTIISGGLSKWCGAGGWRLGTLTFPKELRWLLEAMSNVASQTFTSTSTPIQYAAIKAYEESDEMERYLNNARNVLKITGKVLCEMMQDAEIDIHLPQGGFYLFPDFYLFRENLQARGIFSSKELCERLLEETGVAVLPGSCFGRSEQELTLRIAYVDFDGALALNASDEYSQNGISLDREFVFQNCPRVVEAVKRICDWVREEE